MDGVVKRFGPLDGIRGIAVLIVFLSHTSSRGMSLHHELQFNGIGHIGVYLFFCLSAYLLIGKLLSKEMNLKEAGNFYIKRIFRIWPLYFIVISLVFFLQEMDIVNNEQYLHIKNGGVGFLQHIFFYRGDSVFWSVVVEEQFYIIVPLIVYLLIKKSKLAVIIFVLIIAINFLLYFSHYFKFPVNPDYIKYISTNDRMVGNYLDIFLLSTLFVFVATKYEALLLKYRKSFITISNILFVSAIILTLILVAKQFLFFKQPFYNFRYLTILYVACFMPFIISVKYNNRFNKFLDNWVLRKLGLFGFSIYLLHFLVFQFVNYYIDILPVYKFMISGALLFVVAYISYRFIEKPFINFSYRLINKRSGKYINQKLKNEGY